MGLTKSSTGSNLLTNDFEFLKNNSDYVIALAGNPNVGKSTIFNNLTGMHQHTGNWPGKTVSNATGNCIYKDTNFLLVDIPGTYSILSNSEEEEIARDYICFGNPDCTIVVVDATCLERNLNLVFQTMELTNNIIVCVNLLDEARKKKIHIDLKELADELGVPVVGTTARKKKTLNLLMDTVQKVCTHTLQPTPKKIIYNKHIEDNLAKIEKVLNNEFELSADLCRWIALKLIDDEEKIIKSIEKNLSISLLENNNIQTITNEVYNDLEKNNIVKEHLKDLVVADIMHKSETICGKVCIFEDENYSNRDRKIDKILTSKKFGIPIMLLFLAVIFWLTIVGSNYPSQALFSLFGWIQEKLLYLANVLHSPEWLSSMLISGVYQTLTWIVAVMLPPMAIFFPLFTILEDLGYLPRIAFNMDGFFKKCCCTRKTDDYYVYGIWL